MAWTVLYDEDFSEWLLTVDQRLRLKITSHLEVLEEFGPNLGRPRVDTVKGSGYPNMKELTVQHAGGPWRILFAFDSRRNAILLVGGTKGGNERWYVEHVPIADERFKRHLERLKKEKG